MIKKDRSPFSE